MDKVEEKEEKSGFPFSEAEAVRIKELLKESFQNECNEAQFEGQITCLWTGQSCCFCRCGPHLLCPEHRMNCIMLYGPNIPPNVDPLFKRYMIWQHGGQEGDY